MSKKSVFTFARNILVTGGDLGLAEVDLLRDPFKLFGRLILAGEFLCTAQTAEMFQKSGPSFA